MQFAVQLAADRVDLGDEFVSLEGIETCAKHVESAGFNALFVTDHPVPEDKWLETGGHHSLDPFVTLTTVANFTSALKVMTNILVLPYRNPLIAAKAIATLDVVSNGRVIVGTGAGYLEGEMRAVGVDVKQRGQMVEDALQVMKLAWTGESFSYKGATFEAAGNTVLPRPIQRPHPPIWIGGNSPAAMRRTAQYADGWMPMPLPQKFASRVRSTPLENMEDLAAAINKLRELEQKYEREQSADICMIPFGMGMVSADKWDANAILDQCAELKALGVSWINISAPCGSRAEYLDAVSWFAEEIIKKFD